MLILKFILLLLIFVSSGYIGILVSAKYRNRVMELRNFKEAINILESKIKFTYEPLGEIFKEITKINKERNGISKIFEETSLNMQNEDVSKSWENAVEKSKSVLSLNKEDINVIKGLGKLLRQNRCFWTN